MPSDSPLKSEVSAQTSQLPRPPLTPRNWVETVGALVFAALLVWLVWRQTDAEKLAGVFSRIDWAYYAAAVAVLFVYQIFRTLRTWWLVGQELSFPRLFSTMCTLSLINSYVLAGLGDVGIVYLLRRQHGVTIHLGAATLVMAMIADLAVFCFLFVGLIAVMAHTIPDGVYVVIAGLFALLIVSIGAIVVLGRVTGWEATSAWSARDGILGRLTRFAISLVDALQLVRSPRVFLPVVGLSALMWVFHFLQWLFLLWAIGLPLSVTSVLWIYILAFATTFLPIRGVAAMGPRIAVWFFSLQLVGVGESEAGAAALAVDILLQTLTLWLGIVPLAAMLPAVRRWRR